MDAQSQANELTTKPIDHVVALTKSVVGALPLAGTFLSEVVGTIIPNQRMDRVAKFVEVLEQKFSKLETDLLHSQITNENFTDLIEEGFRQAARSMSDERREQIASLIMNGLTSDEMNFIESKYFLRILGEISDIEVIWLIDYVQREHLGMADISEIAQKHPEVFRVTHRAAISSPETERKFILQESYKAHLAQLKLLEPEIKMDSHTGTPKISFDGNFEVAGYIITSFGKMLIKQIMIEQTD